MRQRAQSSSKLESLKLNFSSLLSRLNPCGHSEKNFTKFLLNIAGWRTSLPLLCCQVTGCTRRTIASLWWCGGARTVTIPPTRRLHRGKLSWPGRKVLSYHWVPSARTNQVQLPRGWLECGSSDLICYFPMCFSSFIQPPDWTTSHRTAAANRGHVKVLKGRQGRTAMTRQMTSLAWEASLRGRKVAVVESQLAASYSRDHPSRRSSCKLKIQHVAHAPSNSLPPLRKAIGTANGNFKLQTRWEFQSMICSLFEGAFTSYNHLLSDRKYLRMLNEFGNIFLIHFVLNLKLKIIFTFGRSETAANNGEAVLCPFRVKLPSWAVGANQTSVTIWQSS